MNTLKKVICAVLSAALVLSSAVVYGSASESSALKLCTVSDVHYSNASLEGTLQQTEKLYERAGIQGQMEYESSAIVHAFIDKFILSDAEVLLVPGDLTDGNIADHRELAGLFSLVEAQGKRVFVINGNHDILSEDREGYTSPKDFAEIYADFGYSEALNRDESSLSYTADLGGGYRLIAVDSCIYGEDKGRITEETATWLESQLEAAKAEGVKLVGIMHHSLLPHMGLYAVTGMQVKESEKLAKKLADSGLNLLFTGHFHANDITVAQTDSGNKVYDVMTGSLITYPNAYRTAEFKGDKVDITTSYIEKIDTAYLPEGFSAQELEAINQDFKAYGKGFLFAGVENWVNSYLGSGRKLCKLLKIDRESAMGKKLDELMPYIPAALTLPIYGESGSLEAIAALSGGSIPESSYESLTQVAATVLSGIYAGDESLGRESLEVKVLLSGLRAAIIYAACGMAGVEDQGIVKAASTVMYAASFADEIIFKLVSPIFDGLTADAYEPGDLNVSLTPYETEKAEGTAPLGFVQWVLRIFKLLLGLLGL